MVRNDEKPVPIPMMARLLDISCSVAIALAVTLGWRVAGCVTPVATRSRVVCARQAASVTMTSRHSSCRRSITQMLSMPICSASCAVRTRVGTGSLPHSARPMCLPRNLGADMARSSVVCRELSGAASAVSTAGRRFACCGRSLLPNVASQQKYRGKHATNRRMGSRGVGRGRPVGSAGPCAEIRGYVARGVARPDRRRRSIL